MLKNLELKIREKLTQYVTGALDLEGLQEFLGPLVWDAESEFDAPTCDLLFSIELTMSEYLSGHWTDSDFAKEMDSLLMFGDFSSALGVHVTRGVTDGLPPDSRYRVAGTSLETVSSSSIRG